MESNNQLDNIDEYADFFFDDDYEDDDDDDDDDMEQNDDMDISSDEGCTYTLPTRKKYALLSSRQKKRNIKQIRNCIVAIKLVKSMHLKFKYIELVESDDDDDDDDINIIVKQKCEINQLSKDLKILKAKEICNMSNKHYLMFKHAAELEGFPSISKIRTLQSKINDCFQLFSNSLG
jgi:hypothetical protein